LAIAFKVLHSLDMAEKNMSLSKEELDLIEFLVAQVASLSSSLTCEDVIAKSLVPPLVASKVVDL
jgi:hypothetical protein